MVMLMKFEVLYVKVFFLLEFVYKGLFCDQELKFVECV